MRQEAFILPAVLLLLALIFNAMWALHDGVVYSLRAQAEKVLAQKAQEQASNRALVRAFQFEASSGKRRLNECFKDESQLPRILANSTICASYQRATTAIAANPRVDSVSAGPAENLPALDFTALLGNVVPCEQAGGMVMLQLPFSISAGSQFSRKYCRLQTQTVEGNRQIDANVEIALPTSMRTNSTLSAKGYLLSTNQLSLEGGAATIVAAGDLSIYSVTASQAVELTLISASGDLRLQHVNPLIRLRVYAKKRAMIPITAQTATRGFQELILDFLPLSAM